VRRVAMKAEVVGVEESEMRDAKVFNICSIIIEQFLYDKKEAMDWII
jgi:hypothetical protein